MARRHLGTILVCLYLVIYEATSQLTEDSALFGGRKYNWSFLLGGLLVIALIVSLIVCILCRTSASRSGSTGNRSMSTFATKSRSADQTVTHPKFKKKKAAKGKGKK